MKDALGNDIIIGNTYGYTQNKNGFTTVVIGTALKLINDKCIIQPIKIERYLWGEPSSFKDSMNKRTISNPILFPIILENGVIDDLHVCIYSRSMNQVYPRLCLVCRKPNIQ